MFDWLNRVFRAVSTTGNVIAAAISHDMVSGLWGYLRNIISLVAGAWANLWGANSAYHDAHLALAARMAGVGIGNNHWISHQGFSIWDLIEHPWKLVDIVYGWLLAKIEATAFSTARVLGKFFLALLVHHLPSVLTVIEDVISAVL